MTLASTMQIRRSLLAAIFCFATAGTAGAEPAPSPDKAPPRLLLKSAQNIRVSLGYKRQHEPASGIRPDKGGWNVIAKTDLTGSMAELVDVTPDATRSRWQVEVKGDKLVLDDHRFLPSHVYQLDVRKEKRLVGSVLVYLYPPQSDGKEKVEFTDEESAGKGNSAKKGDDKKGDDKKGDDKKGGDKQGESAELVRVPKGDL
jgi:hypothetical protein